MRELTLIIPAKNESESLPSVLSELEKFDKETSYYIYCRTGVRSSNSCVLMNEMGFKKTYNLLGGIVEWDGELIK